MSNLGAVLGIMATAFLVGGLARFSVPGPDPMPAWLTIAIGLAGSLLGGGTVLLAGSRDPYVFELATFFVAVALVVAYRTTVQKRPAWGPEALRFPRRGVGVQEYRDRLSRAGIDPDALLDRALEHQRRLREPPPAPPHDSRDESTDEEEPPSASAS